MGELASRIRAKFKRRASASPSIESPTGNNRHSPPAGRPRSLAGIQRPASFAERLPSSRSNHTDKWYANEHVLSPLIPDQEPSAAPQPLQQSPLLSTVTPTPTPAPAPAPTPEPRQELVPARDAKEDARPAARGQSCPGVQPAEAADTATQDPGPEPELRPELQPEPDPAQVQPAQAPEELQPRSEPEPKLPATMSASRSPAGLAAVTADIVPVPNEQELSSDYITINGNHYSVGVGEEAGEQDNHNQQSLADGLAPAASAPTDSAEHQQRQPTDSGSDRADQRARDKMGKVLPSIREHPQDLATDTTDSAAITTDDDDLPRCSYPASPGSDSGAPTPKAPTVAFSSAFRSFDPDTTHAQRTTAETQANQMSSSTSSVPARHSTVPPLASSATEIPGAAQRRSPTSHSNANFQQHSPPASPSAAAQMQAMQQMLQALLGGGARAEEPLGANGGQLPAVASKKRVWVRRPSASATLIHIGETDVVDDVRDLILRKYANSLGRQFDSPDLTLRIIPREHQRERALSPDENMARILDACFPGGQSVEEALLIDVPLRRTPRPSPHVGGAPHMQMMNAPVYYGPPSEDRRPPENGTDYFGPAVVNGISLSNGIVAHPHSISVINTGQIPQIPSPGGTRTRAYRDRPDRPRLGRQHTSSPTVMNLLGTHHQPAAQLGVNAAVEQAAASPPMAPPMPTPPGSDGTMQIVATPPAGAPARVASPRPSAARQKKSKKSTDHPKLQPGVFSGGVPPINILIVEDNPINLRLLEVFVKRLKVRWQTAVNGREAVDKWRQGGFHLVLMDIQLPVMSGLDATREIRRLERVNSIAALPSRRGPADVKTPPKAEDCLSNLEKFKSPVIIVALTASSLQSDRHEALMAGCNDFLTKPVNFVWFEKKIMEWGCMQALIDYDGWSQWRQEYIQWREQQDESKKSASSKTKSKKNRSSSASTISAGPSNSAAQ